jgi:hypothetical protein
MNHGLIIFIKNPELGKVKTRLAKTIGNQKALEVYKLLQEKTREVSLGVNAQRFLFYSDTVSLGDSWNDNDFFKLQQVNGGLGERMEAAFQAVFSNNVDKAIIIGSDCYDITPELIERAYQRLDNNDVVIGPANDGGYYLIGMKKNQADLFQNMVWSTETVFQETIVKIQKKGRTFEVLPTLIDIDTEDDLTASSFNMEVLSLT